MRRFVALSAAAVIGSSACVLMSASHASAQIVNPSFESPTNTAGGTDTNVTGWTLNPAVGQSYTNPGNRCTFATPTPDGDSWSFWLQTFVQSGSTTQVVDAGAITPGTSYTFSDQMAFEVPGYNAVLLVNQSPNTGGNGVGPNTGNLYSYMTIQYENHFGQPLGAPFETDIPAGSVASANHVYVPYSVAGVAPATAYQALLTIGWNQGGQDANMGGQSAFATATAFAPTVVPEPATLSVLALGSAGLFMRRRSKTA